MAYLRATVPDEFPVEQWGPYLEAFTSMLLARDGELKRLHRARQAAYLEQSPDYWRVLIKRRERELARKRSQR